MDFCVGYTTIENDATGKNHFQYKRRSVYAKSTGGK